MEKKDIKREFCKLELDLHGFFWVYFGTKAASEVSRHWDRGLPMVREAVLDGNLSQARLGIYGDAIQNLIRYHELKDAYAKL